MEAMPLWWKNQVQDEKIHRISSVDHLDQVK
jgi:hypothetical protein